MAETQVLFRIGTDLLDALDRVLASAGFRTRSEWFRAQVRRALDDAKRSRLADSLERLTVKGIREDEIVEMVRDWRAKKRKR